MAFFKNPRWLSISNKFPQRDLIPGYDKEDISTNWEGKNAWFCPSNIASYLAIQVGDLNSDLSFC